MTATLHLGVVAPLVPDGVEAIVVAAAFRREIEHRLGPVVVDFRTTEANRRPLDPTSWRELRTADWSRSADAVVIDRRLEGDPIVRGALNGVEIVVSTDCFEHPSWLASVLARHLDEAALDSRRRMLVHLGVLPERPQTISDMPDAMPLTAADLYLVAQQFESTSDPVVAALAGQETGDPRMSIDELTSELRRRLPASRVETIEQLHDRALAAERAVTEERLRHESESAALEERLADAESLVEQYRRREALHEAGLRAPTTNPVQP